MFSGSGNTERLVLPTSGYVGNQSWRPYSGSKNIPCISASIHVINENPTVVLMFSGLGYTTRLLRRLPDVWISCELTMSFVNRKLLSAIFDSLQLCTSSGFRSSLIL